MTSSMPMGCVGVSTHFGQTITGRRSTRARTISNDRLPDPMITDERNSITGTVPDRRMRPTSWRLSRWVDMCGPLPSAPRYTMRFTPARSAAARKLRAESRSARW